MEIISSAIRFQMKDDNYWQITTGKRHGDCFKRMYDLGIEYNKLTCEQGFLTDSFKFLNRKEAVYYAKACGQIPIDFSNNELYSEDLW